jgi:hypothetical protein
MFKQLIRRFSNVPPPVAIISVIVAIVAASGAALLLSRSEPKAGAFVAPRAARIERVEGSVGLAHSLNPNSEDQLEWDEAVVNAPLTVGDRIYARDNSHAAVAFTGRNYARLDPGASLDVLSLADRRTQLALRGGSAIFDVGELADSELFEVATPNGAVDFNEPGLYQVGIGDNGNTIISVLSGLAQVVGVEGYGQIGKGEILTLVGQAATQVLLSKLAPDLAGNIVDDYYDYRYPNTYDGRYSDYDAYLDDPYYYDQYRHSASYNYLSEEIPGLYDLDRYGDWADVDGYGQCWAPRVEADWSPYRSGYWDVNDLWGPTWVAEEPWGWAPYHYGRWAYANNQRWVWVPEDCRTNPVYAPALVAFVPLQQSNQIAWAPLAPGERYLPRYYDADFQPRYFAPREVVTEVVNERRSYANFNYPAAVTVIPVQEFRHRIDRQVILPTNAQLIAQSQAVTDPFAVDGLRQAAMKDEFAGRRVKVPRGLRQGAFNTPVVTSVAPALPPGRSDVAQALRVEPVPEKQRRNKLKFNDSGQVVAARRADGLPQAFTERALPAVNQERQQRMAALAQQAQQGDKSARTELRALKREQRKEERAAQVVSQQQAAQQSAIQQDQSRQQRMAAQQAQADQTREQRKAQRQLERQQRDAANQQQQRAVMQQGEQRKQQEQIQRAQRQAAQQAQMGQQREQMKAQRRAERQQRAMTEGQNRQAAARQAAQQAQVNQANEARKAQRRAEAAQRQQQAQQQMQQRRQQDVQQQRKQMIQIQQAEKHQQARQQQAQQQQQMRQQQMQQQREQMKAQRRAERQQAAPQMRAPAMVGPPARQGQPDQGQRKGGRRKP